MYFTIEALLNSAAHDGDAEVWLNTALIWSTGTSWQSAPGNESVHYPSECWYDMAE